MKRDPVPLRNLAVVRAVWLVVDMRRWLPII